MIDATEEQFARFVALYPRTLVRDINGIIEPPVLSYNDFTLGKWPDSIVAWCYLERDGTKSGFKILHSVD